MIRRRRRRRSTVDPQIDRPLSVTFCDFYPTFRLKCVWKWYISQAVDLGIDSTIDRTVDPQIDRPLSVSSCGFIPLLCSNCAWKWYISQAVDLEIDSTFDRPLNVSSCDFYQTFLLELRLEVLPIASCRSGERRYIQNMTTI